MLSKTVESLYTYDFSTLYTTLPHNLIKDKPVDLIEKKIQREDSLYIACNDRHALSPLMHLNFIIYGLVRKLSPFSETIFILDLDLVDKLKVFLWVLIVPLL